MYSFSGDENGVRTFLYDIFYHKYSRNHVFICVLLDVWPSVLAWHGHSTKEQMEKGQMDPLVDTIFWMIYNTGPASSLQDLRVILKLLKHALFVKLTVL